MNTRTWLAPASASIVLACFAPAAWNAVHERAAPTTASAPLESDFLVEFKRLLAANNVADMQKLIKTRLTEAVPAIVEVGEEISVQPSEELEKLSAALREAWKASQKSEFAERSYRYFSSLDAGRKKDRKELKAQYEKMVGEFEANLDKKEAQTYDFVEAKLRSHVDYFDQIGDDYLASQTAYMLARCMDDTLRQGGDLNLAWKYYVRAIEFRDKLDLKDPAYEDAVRRRNLLASKGYDKKKEAGAPDEPGGKDGGGAPPAPLGQALKVPMNFELVAAVDTFQRPNFFADEITEIWVGVQMEKKSGNKGTFPSFTNGPVLLRVGASDLRLDLNGDGQGDEKVPLTGNVTPVKVTVGKDADAHPWGFLCTLGSNKAAYQGMEVNLAPSDDRMVLFALGAASVVGNVGGVNVRVIDETLDGVYGSMPQTFNFEGLSKDVYQPVFDSIVVGNSKHGQPWSDWVDLDGKWYRMAIEPDGKQLVATPAAPKTGMIKLEFKGAPVQPSVLIVQGKADLEKSYFDLSEAGPKGIPVPIGDYQLFYGELRKGKKKQIQKCLILPGKSVPTWKVRAGETTTIELGGPFSFDFATQHDGEKITIDGASVRVVGKAGERYERTWNCVPHPEVAWRKKGTKKASKYERMPICMDNETINKKGWGAPWAPLDLTLETKGAGSEIEVQLIDKKSDLFGKIESEWKE